MKHACSLLASSLFLVVTATGCYAPDREAIQAKMYTECRLSPPGPVCACAEGPDAPACDYVFDYFVQESLQSSAEEECILEAECSGGDTTAEQSAALQECVRLERAVDLSHLGQSRDPECLEACSGALSACGGAGAEGCDVDVTAGCFDDYDACREACWSAA